MKRLEGKVILVAGGGGIGNALSRHYGAEGASVVIGDNHPDRGQAVADGIVAAGGTAASIRLDGRDEDSIAAAVALAEQRYGGLDGLHVNFAALSEARDDSDVVNIPLDVFDRTMEVNARGYLLCTRHAIPAIIARGGGSVIYTGSAAAYVSEPVRVAYAMSKAAGHALMRHVAAAYGPQGVRANVIAPGMVRHEGWDRMPPDMATGIENAGKSVAAIKSRIARPEDVSAMGVLLMSDAGSYITGQVMGIDGGTTMRP
ncbi:NAD(P)-dependent dehydrogenase, short-chain alcohol dehydrogenase family [Novosphingobium sp. CF614]|uniref:SDR family NAD(P)-dependent oxidoreductase n=1 Tax=Novosphingobium sp. CF614 TaxID=1884364 RepID=UPI0008E14C30|nr:SDR family oxidoreductase [Novosphingobium sp. CF614]SFG01110.1 NAD(P)-dependent dehydrogenase, short-chain alcohol dehydrogenase family [Novosphingobium sp. CF614]